MSKMLYTNNKEHLRYNFDDLLFEVLGGLNTASYTSLRVMLIVSHKREKIRDWVDLYNDAELDQFTRKVAERTGLTAKYVKEAFDSLIEQLENYKLDLIKAEGNKSNPTIQLTDEEQQESEIFLKQPKLVERLNQLIGNTGMVGEEKNRLILFLTYLSRKMDVPIHSIIQSQYNYLQSQVGILIPDEDKIEISHLSDNCLFYYQEDELLNKVLLIEDTDNKNRKRLLPLFDIPIKGQFTKTTIHKDEFGRLRTVQKKVNGQGVVLSISTKAPQSFHSLEAHHFFLTEQKDKTHEELQLDYQRKVSAGKINRIEEQKAVQFIQNIQRVIEPIKVINPYAEELQLPNVLQHSIFANSQYLRFIEVITLLHQYQRNQKADELTGELYIETTIEDIEQANELLSEILLNKCDMLNQPTRIYFEKLKAVLSSINAKAFSTHEIHLRTGIPKTTIKRHNSFLLEKGFITYDEQSEKHSPKYKLSEQNEYDKLEKHLLKALHKSIQSIQTASPSTKVDQIESGLHKALKNNKQMKVAQEVEGCIQNPTTDTKQAI